MLHKQNLFAQQAKISDSGAKISDSEAARKHYQPVQYSITPSLSVAVLVVSKCAQPPIQPSARN